MKAKSKITKNMTTFDQHLDNRYGKIGSIKRTKFEIKAKAFLLNETAAISPKK